MSTLDLAAAATARLADEVRSCTRPSHPYPWDGLEAQLGASARALPLVGYGSLLNLQSAQRTIPRASTAGTALVIVAGGRRLFNYRMSGPALLRYEGTAPPNDSAALNVAHTRQPSHLFNGRLYSIPPAEIDALRQREVGYDLCPMPFVHWADPLGPAGTAYVLSCRSDGPYGESLIASTLLPPPGYYAVCRDAARSISAAFLDAFLATTYLADGITTAVRWEAQGARP